MNTVIISGGTVAVEELKTLLRELTGPKEHAGTFSAENAGEDQSREETSDRVVLIAADKGMETVRKLGLVPDYIIGDFDSADGSTYAYARELAEEGKSELTKLNPVKDDTDSEAALHLAFEKTEGPIYFFGGTGTRLDHILSNLMTMKQGLEQNRRICLIDSHNRVQLTDAGHPLRLERDRQFGKYVSVIPLSGPAHHVNLTGFYYPLSDAVLTGADSLGNSNEITADRAEISVGDGICAVIEARD